MVYKGNGKAFYACLIASVFIIQGMPTQVTPHLAAFCQLFPNLPMTTVMFLGTIPVAIAVPASFLIGWFVKKMGLKATLLMGVISFVVGGFLPLFAPETFGWLIICRFIAGWGYGVLYSLAVTLVSMLYAEGQLRQTMMGVGTAFQLIGVIAASFLTGALVSTFGDLSAIWYGTVLMVPALIFSVFAKLPRDASEGIEAQIAAQQDQKEADKEAVRNGLKPKKEKLNKYVWFYVICMAPMGIICNQAMLYISNVIVDNGFGGTYDVAGVVSVHATAAMVVSFFYGLMYKGVGKRMTFVIATAMAIVGNWFMGTADSLMDMYIGSCLTHAGFGWQFSAISMLIAQVTPASRVAEVNGYVMAILNLGGFFAGNVAIWMTSLFGRPNDLQFAYLLGAAIYVIMVIVFIFVRPKETVNQQEALEDASAAAA